MICKGVVTSMRAHTGRILVWSGVLSGLWSLAYIASMVVLQAAPSLDCEQPLQEYVLVQCGLAFAFVLIYISVLFDTCPSWRHNVKYFPYVLLTFTVGTVGWSGAGLVMAVSSECSKDDGPASDPNYTPELYYTAITLSILGLVTGLVTVIDIVLQHRRFTSRPERWENPASYNLPAEQVTRVKKALANEGASLNLRRPLEALEDQEGDVVETLDSNDNKTDGVVGGSDEKKRDEKDNKQRDQDARERERIEREQRERIEREQREREQREREQGEREQREREQREREQGEREQREREQREREQREREQREREDREQREREQRERERREREQSEREQREREEREREQREREDRDREENKPKEPDIVEDDYDDFEI